MRNGFTRFSNQLSKVASALSTVGFILAGVIFTLMVLLVLSDMLLRATGSNVVLNAAEFAGYAFAAMIYLSLGYSFKAGVHIRITFVLDRLPPRPRHWLEVLMSTLASLLTGYALHAVWELVRTSYTRGTVAYTAAQTPLYLPQAVLLAGLLILLVQLLAHTAQLLAAGSKETTPSTEGGALL